MVVIGSFLQKNLVNRLWGFITINGFNTLKRSDRINISEFSLLKASLIGLAMAIFGGIIVLLDYLGSKKTRHSR